MNEISKNIVPHDYKIDRQAREGLLKQKAQIIWFVGLSGSGKSTIANIVEQKLHEKGYATYLLDGDNVRMGLNKDLGFSDADREENIRRIGQVAKLFVDAGTIVLSAFVSPFEKDRQQVRDLVGDGEFVEVFVNCPLEVCEQRDVKGLYAKARAGEIKDFTGISSPFEEPKNPEVEVRTDLLNIEESVDKIVNLIIENQKRS